jgi:D-threo-aldose 1-dehydrogenase
LSPGTPAMQSGPTDGIELGALGFGTGFLRRLATRGRLRTRGINRLLATAMEEGVTHFDTAPIYGYGEAEGLLGRFLAPRRNELTVTTKIGIPPPPAISRLVPGRLVRGPLSSGAQNFEVRSVRTSFERSLRRLRTDYVDILLLHECAPDRVTDELLEFLEGRVADGTARAVGTATSRRETAEIAQRWTGFPDVALVPWEPGLVVADLTDLGLRQIMTHSSVKFALTRVWRPMQTRPNQVNRWSDELGVDCARSDVMAGLALALAQRDNPSGRTLFSSRVVSHVRDTCQHARAYTGDTELLERFEQLLRSEVAHSPPG